MTGPRSSFEHLRTAEFSALDGVAYLNAASLGPIPDCSRLAMAAYNERRSRAQSMREEDFVHPLLHTRELAARLLGADVAEIALGSNTSFGINLAAGGLRVSPGSVVLVSDREFPANVYPWMRRDRLRLELVPVNDRGWTDEDRILERLQREDVSIVSISSVQFDNGYRADLNRIGQACRDRGAFFVIDAIQSLGCLPLDVGAVKADVVAVGGHKWLCGPFGAGFAYVRREVQDRLDPGAIGWSSMASSQNIDSVLDYDWRLLPDARRYEVATQPFQDYVGLAQSLRLILDSDPQAIWAHVDTLLQPLRAWLIEHPEVEVRSSADPLHRSGIVGFRPPTLESTFQALKHAGVVCSVREGAVRIAAHFYNSASDIDRVMEVLDSQAQVGWE